MPHMFPRSRRIEDLLRKEMADMLLGEIKDPRIQGLVTKGGGEGNVDTAVRPHPTG